MRTENLEENRVLLNCVLEYKSRGRGFESYSGHFHSHKLSRLIFQILLLLKFNWEVCWVEKNWGFDRRADFRRDVLEVFWDMGSW